MKVVVAVVICVAVLAVQGMRGQNIAPAPTYPFFVEPRDTPSTVPSVRWEYSVIHVADDGLEAMLNGRGQQGWEAFSIRETGRGLQVAFKRPRSHREGRGTTAIPLGRPVK